MNAIVMTMTLASIVIFAGCASPVKLDTGASNVEIVDYIKPELRDKLVEVDQVKCQIGENGRTRSANVEGCNNTLKNAAAKMGGRLVLVKSTEPEHYEMKSTLGALTGVKQCDNCVLMNGVVYKDKK